VADQEGEAGHPHGEQTLHTPSRHDFGPTDLSGGWHTICVSRSRLSQWCDHCAKIDRMEV